MQFNQSCFIIMATFTKKEILDANDAEKGSGVKYILNKLLIEENKVHSEDLKRLVKMVASLISKRKVKYKKTKKNNNSFTEKNVEWINSQFLIPELRIKSSSDSSSLKRGRPCVEFEKMSDRSKRRAIAKISQQCENDPLKILLAARQAAIKSQECELSSVLKKIIENPEYCVKIKQSSKATLSLIVKSPEEALAFLIDNGLSKSVYTNIRLATKLSGADVWPPYDRLKEAKEQCRPLKEFIQINENEAKCDLQALLNHTARRIAELQQEVVLLYAQKSNFCDIEAVFIFSWGFDGTSGFPSFKQPYSESSVEKVDTNLLACTCIPLRLVTSNGTILWNNAISQSEKFCRPISLKWIKETTEIIKSQKQIMDEQINKLECLEIEVQHFRIRLHFSLHMTLIDGKVLNALTDTTSSQSCPICHATPKQFNDLSNIATDVFLPITGSLQHGISPLHAWIKILECCLNISYRKNIRKWRVSNEVDKKEYSRRKAEIQDILWKKLGLKVDMPKDRGCGNSNDGNSARRAFQNSEVFANCLELNTELVTNFSIILMALSCHLPIDPNKFNILCHQTARIYVANYNWYFMPATVHKILIHGSAIIENSILPVGMFAEEASEARNKNYKCYRERHSRKCSREATMQDMFLRSMDSSDPLIASHSLSSRLQKRKKLPLPSAVIALLALPEVPQSEE